MDIPNIPHEFRDPKRKITIIVWAYRKLEHQEAQGYALYFARTHKLKRGCKYDVITTIE